MEQSVEAVLTVLHRPRYFITFTVYARLPMTFRRPYVSIRQLKLQAT